jgi:biotin--protein ligase
MSEKLACVAATDAVIVCCSPWMKKHGIDRLVLSEGANETTKRLFTHFFPRLTTARIGRVVLYQEQLHSTQQMLHDTYRDAPEHTLCFTPVQTQGKGRGSNIWTSPNGCLTCSFTSTFHDGQSLPFVQYLVSLAVVHTAQRFSDNVDVKIKWPNDIYTQDMKIGGILCQSEYSNGEFHVTTGKLIIT